MDDCVVKKEPGPRLKTHVAVCVVGVGEKVTWTNWGRGHPRSSFHGIRDCVRMVRGSGTWRWHETPCALLNWKYRFICQYGESDQIQITEMIRILFARVAYNFLRKERCGIVSCVYINMPNIIWFYIYTQER